MALALIAIVALVAILLVDFFHLNRGPRIPGTFRFPIVGDLFLLGKHFYGLFDYMSEKLQTMGNRPICMIVGRYRIWGIVHPTDVEHILKGNWKNYTVGKGIRGDSLGDLFGDGIFHADGECWYTQRRMNECLNTINVFVSSLVEQRKKQTSGEERQDLFARLFMISETEKDEAKDLQYLRDMTVNFLIAGRDTTACALSVLGV